MIDTSSTPAAPPTPRRSWLVVAPVAIFAGLALLFAFALGKGDPSKLPSALIGKAAPAAALPPVAGLRGANEQPLAGFSGADLANGRVSIVNFWASWCTPCIEEHPHLLALAKRTGVPIFGVNHKDLPANASRFIDRYGNPYAGVGADPNGRVAIEWGVYGMPETFVVDGQGRIAYKHVGPITRESLESRILPAIDRARSGR